MQITIYSVCRNCGGDGVYEFSSGGETSQCACPGCGGTGKLATAHVELNPGLDDLLDKINDVLGKCNDILEKLNERQIQSTR
jgi:hypothetical protein